MQAEFWQQRWKNGRIRFHSSQVNALLLQYWPQLNLLPKDRVLVPLCGKSLDMPWLLKQGHKVVGVELVEQALHEFSAENQLAFSREHVDELVRWDSADLSVYQGDVFHLNKKILGPIAAIYDRAALIAWPKPQRQAYAQHLKSLMSKGTQMLLISMEYEQEKMNGPPFSVAQAEIEALFSDSCKINVLHTEHTKVKDSWKDRGMQSLHEKVYHLVCSS